jgi:nicotinate (nicotinamide) nucleotide adenylyltransferase
MASMASPEQLSSLIEQVAASAEPTVAFIKRGDRATNRVGVFASSFNPPTTAHVELIKSAATKFELDQTIAIAGAANADKVTYECSLEDRLSMLLLTFDDDPTVSIGISSHAFFVDMTEALSKALPPAVKLHFILGSDTFERLVDPAGIYLRRYWRRFASSREALSSLLAHSRLIVAGRGSATRKDLNSLVAGIQRDFLERILFLDLPPDLRSRSATEVRRLIGRGQEIGGLVSKAVERFIIDRRLYRESA